MVPSMASIGEAKNIVSPMSSESHQQIEKNNHHAIIEPESEGSIETDLKKVVPYSYKLVNSHRSSSKQF